MFDSRHEGCEARGGICDCGDRACVHAVVPYDHELDISVRAYNSMKRHSLSVPILLSMSKSEVLALSKIGVGQLAEFEEALAQYDLKFDE